jgi:hypothetical protein
MGHDMCDTPVYQDIYPDLCEMRCYVVVHKYRLAIDLESELAVASPLKYKFAGLCAVATQRDYPHTATVRQNKELILYFVKPYRPYNRNTNRA